MKELLIVGGGSAGWMAAAYLNGALNARGDTPRVNITLLESPDIPRISVGEATIPSMRHLLSVVGIPEIEFMRATDATFKQSIKYQNWVNKDGSFYHHPFTSMREQPLDHAGENWLASDQSLPFMDTCSVQPAACEAALAPAMKQRWSLPYRLNYAYHIDASLYAKLLRQMAEADGVVRREGKISSVEQDPQSGYVTALVMESGDRIEGDLFVDCSGFRSILLGQELGEAWEDWTH